MPNDTLDLGIGRLPRTTACGRNLQYRSQQGLEHILDLGK